MLLMIVSLLALLAGPLLYTALVRNDRLHRVLDGFIFMTVGGLIVTIIVPETLAVAGWPVFLVLALGFFLPTLSERVLHYTPKRVHLAALIFGILGLALHATTDGATLGTGHESESAQALVVGVLLHRIPIGLTIWWFVRPQYGSLNAWLLLGLIAFGTLIGFIFAPGILEPLGTSGMALFQAFVAGSLAHVVFHRAPKPGDDCGHGHGHSHGANWWEGLGNLLGAGLLIFMYVDHHHHEHSDWIDGFSHTLTDLSLESAPALLLAYIMAGLATAFMPQSYIRWMSAGRAWKQSLRGVVVGLPLPVCSCGVVPLYHSLIRKGAPPAAAMAFLIATPEIGIDAILISLPLLGGTMTVVRVVAAAIVALLVGILIGRIAPILMKKLIPDGGQDEGPPMTTRQKLRYGLVDGVQELVDHTGPWILVGLLLAAAINPILGDGGFDWVPAGLEVPMFALLGMPLYVCASGATPLIAVFLAGGVSPGAALAFLLTGPATNITTFGILNKLHGRKTAFLFGLATLVITIALGYLVNVILPDYQPITHGEEHHHWSWFHKIALFVLILMFLGSMLRRGARAFVGELFSQGGHDHDHDHGHGHGHHHDHDHDHSHHHDHHDHGHGHHHSH